MDLIYILFSLISFTKTFSYASVVVSLDQNTFDNFRNGPGVKLVFFQKHHHDKDSQQLMTRFLEEYQKSAEIIETYKVKFAKLVCDTTVGISFCGDENAGKAVHVFRNGHNLISLTLENMFDVDSIVSNVLQIVLLKTVPIVQQLDERLQFVSSHRYAYDCFFSYHNAIGTHAHRVFMEIAFAYQSRYKFALTTEQSVANDLRDFNQNEKTALWYFRCVHLSSDQPCAVYKYRDAMDLTSLARFLNAIDWPLIEVLKENQDNPFIGRDVHTVLLFYDQNLIDWANLKAHVLIERFYGIIGVLLIDVDEVDAGRHGYSREHTTLPSVNFLYRGDNLYHVMSADGDPVTFVNNLLSRVIRTIPRIRTGDSTATNHVPPPNYDTRYTEEEDAKLEELIETEDDQVAAVAYQRRREEIDRQYIPALNDKTFYQETQNKDLIFVLFYLKFDPKSMITLRHFSNASHQLAADSLYPLAGVDCFDWTDVCAREKVTAWPILRAYRKDKAALPYRGMLSSQSFVQFIHLLLAGSPIQLHTLAEYEDFINGKLPKQMHIYSDISVVGLFNSADDKELSLFLAKAEEKQGTMLFGYLVGETANTIAEADAATSLPALRIEKRHDPLTSRVQFDNAWNREALQIFLQNGQLSNFPELRVDNLPSYLAQKKPFIILFIERIENHTTYEIMLRIAEERLFQDFIFCWMDLKESVSRRLLHDYKPDASAPALVFVSHASGEIYSYSGHKWTVDALRSWIEAVTGSKLSPSKMLEENDWVPRFPGYDFLKMIAKEEIKKRKREAMQNSDDLDDFEDEIDAANARADAVTRTQLNEDSDNSHQYHGGMEDSFPRNQDMASQRDEL